MSAASKRAGPGPGTACFHCGLPVPATGAAAQEAPEGTRWFCCAGCDAVSLFIRGAGLDDYYRLRAANARPPETDPHLRETLELYDEPAMLARFATRVSEGVLEAELVIGAMTCPACAWLVEHAMQQVPGVIGVSVSYSLRRATVRWKEGEAKASAIFDAVLACGCQAWPFESGKEAAVAGAERKSMLLRFLVAALGMMQVMMYAAPAYLAGDGEMTPDVEGLMRWAGFILTIPVIGYSAAPFFRNAWNELRAKRLGVDAPVALGLGAAFAASAWSTIRGSGAVYFDSVAMFVFFVTGARLLERAALERAGRSLQRLAALVPSSARRLRDPQGEEVVAAAQLAPGDRVVVRAGESVPADGVLASAHATVSEALLSGESAPLERFAGERVIGGSVNCGDAFIVRVTRVGTDTVLSTLRRMMERAAAGRAPWAEAAQRAVRIFVPLVIVAAVLAGAAWLPHDPGRALWIAVSVLIVTCPCALSLAAPAALCAATGVLARGNVVVTSAPAIEALAGATDFVFDKTGTLTAGAPELIETQVFGRLAPNDALGVAAALGADSPHPVDHALREAARTLDHPAASRTHRSPGHGIEGGVESTTYRLGNAAYCAELHGREFPLADRQEAHTRIWLADRGGWIAAFRVADALRPEAAESIASLRALGVALHLLSGDEYGVAQRVATQLGIPHMQAHATPERKQAYVRALQLRGAKVCMVGDGINDAPVLAQADVSVAMGGGSDLAQVRADAVLASDSLPDLVAAVRVARKTRAVIRENLAWAFAYNAVVIPLAIAGQVTPLVAAIAMSASSLIVVANALRIR